MMERADTIMQRKKLAIRFKHYQEYKDILRSKKENTAKDIMMDKNIQIEYDYFVGQRKVFGNIHKQVMKIERKLKKQNSQREAVAKYTQ